MISRADMNFDPMTGVALFAPQAIDRLLGDIDRHLGIPKEQAISYDAMKDLRMSVLQQRTTR